MSKWTDVRIRWDVSVAPDVLAAQPDRDRYIAEVLDLQHAVNAEDLTCPLGRRAAAA